MVFPKQVRLICTSNYFSLLSLCWNRRGAAAYSVCFAGRILDVWFRSEKNNVTRVACFGAVSYALSTDRNLKPRCPYVLSNGRLICKTRLFNRLWRFTHKTRLTDCLRLMWLKTALSTVYICIKFQSHFHNQWMCPFLR